MENTSEQKRMIRVVMTEEEWIECKVLAARGRQTLGEMFTTIIRRLLAEKGGTA